MSKIKETVFLTAILIIAFYFRFDNLNWDDNQHLHPDERFLTMVGTDMKLPNSFHQYFDQKTSLMNPENIGHNFFVYGTFPLTLNKSLANYYKADNYNDFTVLGRKLSAFLDLLAVIFVYQTAKVLIGKSQSPSSNRIIDNHFQKTEAASLPLWSAFFYATVVLPIQLSHFFAVDSFLNFFMLASFYLVLKYSVSLSEKSKTVVLLILSASFFGLSLGSKITALFILPLIMYFIIFFKLERGRFFTRLLHSAVFLSVAYLVLRFADPYMFANASFLDPRLSQSFVGDLKELRLLTQITPNNFFPPMIQWLSINPVLHSIVNNSVFGLGIVHTLLVIIGVWQIIRKMEFKIPFEMSVFIRQIFGSRWIAIFCWVFAVFVYQALQNTPALRYFLIIYPFLAIFAGLGILKLAYLIRLALVFIILLWPVMFSSVYRNKHTRVEASEWIYKNVNNGSAVANEHWDDGLPLQLEQNYGKEFRQLELPVFHPDDESKWIEMNKVLASADYYILSSNRGWGSITKVPDKYPRMAKFYQNLFAGKTDFKKVAEFTSYPKLCLGISDWCLVFIDDWADETFTVYDHPKVMIYRKEL